MNKCCEEAHDIADLRKQLEEALDDKHNYQELIENALAAGERAEKAEHALEGLRDELLEATDAHSGNQPRQYPNQTDQR
jgi:DNA repair exonuclease SbcCD ATPase subunit